MKSVSTSAKNLETLHLNSTNAIDIEGIRCLSDECKKLRAITLAWADSITDEVKNLLIAY